MEVVGSWRRDAKGWEKRERGRGCYPDGCRQRSDRSAALRAVPEPRATKREPTLAEGADARVHRRARTAAIGGDCSTLPRFLAFRQFARGWVVPPRRSPFLYLLREDCARGAQRGGDPLRNSSVVLRYIRTSLALFRPFARAKGRERCLRRDFTPRSSGYTTGQIRQ